MLTRLCLLQKLLLEDNMSVEQVRRMARWGFGALAVCQRHLLFMLRVEF